MRHQHLILISTLFAAALIGGILSLQIPTAHAQEQLPVTIEQTQWAQIEATNAAAQAEWEEKISQHSIDSFHVAYLIKEDVTTADHLFSPDMIKAHYSATPVHTWDDFLVLNAQYPVNIVILHESMLDEVDQQWISNAYRNDVLIVGFNIRKSTLAALVEDECQNPGQEDLLDYFDNTAIYFEYTHVVLTGDEDHKAIIEEHLDTVTLETCKDEDNDVLKGVTTAISHGVYQLPVHNIDGLEYIRHALVTSAVNYRITAH